MSKLASPEGLFNRDGVDDPLPEQIERRKRWVAALRSGKWTQTRGVLGIPGTNKRCCLGVACEREVLGVQLPEPDLESWKERGGVVEWEHYIVYHNSGYSSQPNYLNLPDDAQTLLGFLTNEPRVYVELPKGVRLMSLAHLNDEGTAFDLIADLIEEQYIAPFEPVV